jgi:hypothetical protein
MENRWHSATADDGESDHSADQTAGTPQEAEFHGAATARHN